MTRNESELTGRRFARWVVISRDTRPRYWMCRCDCGTVRSVFVGHLKRGNTSSCGCLHKELSKARATKHDAHGSPEYRAWSLAKTRCTNPNREKYRRYGARGIRMCERWANDFSVFLADMGHKPAGTSLERINNDGPYAPDNCRWATPAEQSRNTIRNKRITIDGETRIASDWASSVGVPAGRIYARLRAGWTHREVVYGKR